MDKCRICLKAENNLHSLNEIEKWKKVSLKYMVTSIANVKILLDEDHNKICSPCQLKVTEAYDFKMLIERSDMILHDKNPKEIIKFSYISEIKNKLAYKEEVDCKPFLTNDLMEAIGRDKTCTTYHNTTITKINSRSKEKKKETPDLQFLQTIKTEITDEDFSHNNDIEDYSPNSDRDDEYIPWKPQKKKYTKKRTHEVTKSGKVCNVRIKPVYLKDVRVLYYDPQDRINKKKLYKLKYTPRIRMDICCYCGKLTKSLKIHQLTHTGERKFSCDICSKRYFTEYQLNHHKKSHSDIRNYKCDICVATFVNPYLLQNHLKMHSDIMNFFCNICNKGFKRKSSLMRHIKQHNSGNKNIKCELCNMTFYTKSALQNHMRVHTGERPYKCEICSQPYSYKRDFNRHCFKKHGVFLNRRSVNVMNEEILKRERALMKELLLRKQGIIKDDQPLNPFQGPQAAMAYEQVMQVLETRSIHEDFVV